MPSVDLRPTIRRVGILQPGQAQAPFLEYSIREQRWRVWLSYNQTVSAGTYLDLYPSGQCDRVTIGPDGAPRNITTILQEL